MDKLNPYILAMFGCILSVLGTILVFQFKGMKESMDSMAAKIGELNEKIAAILKDQKWHKEEIDELKQDIKDIYAEISKLR